METHADQQGIFLGIVTRLVAGAVSRAVIEPLFRANDKRTWEPVADRHSDFPNRGTISWLNPPLADVDEGSLWEFRIVEQPTYDRGNPAHDQYRLASSPTPIRDAIRLSGKTDEVRQQVVVQGLSLLVEPSPTVFLLLDNGQWLGPLLLVRRDNGAWYADSKQLDSPLDCGSDLKVNDVQISGVRRTVLAPGQQAGGRRGQIDWSSDAKILERALRGLRQHDTPAVQALTLTKRAIEEAIERLNIGEAAFDWSLDQQRLKRAQVIVQQLEGRQKLAALVQGEILALPVSKRTIEAAAEEARRSVEVAAHAALETARREAEREVERLRAAAADAREAESASARERLAAAEAEIAAAQEVLTGIREQITAEEAALRQARDDLSSQLAAREEQLTQLERSLDDRLLEIMERPDRVLADVAIVAALQRTLTRESVEIAVSRPNPDSPARAPLIERPGGIFPVGEPIPITGQPQATLKMLYQHFKANLLPLRMARNLHAACLSGAVPIVTGDGADLALDLYGDVVAGGRVLRIPVTPTMLEPGDLFGRVDSARRRFIPHAGGLLDALIDAQSNDKLTLVVLDGINRAQIESLFLPIADCYAATWTGQRHSRLRLVHPTAVEQDDPSLLVSPLSWPAHVLLVATLTEGTATLPLPTRLWDTSLLFHFDGYYTEEIEGNPQLVAQAPALPSLMNCVPGKQWCEWRERLRSMPVDKCTELLDSLANADLWIRASAQRLDTRFFAALRLLLLEQGRALEDVLIQGLIPQCGLEQADKLVEATAAQPWRGERFGDALELMRPWLQ